MVISRVEYAFMVIKRLKSINKRYVKLLEKSKLPFTERTPKQNDKLNVDLNWNRMNYEMERERLGYAMGFLSLNDLRDYYEPSAFHKYKGVRDEMEKIQFND